MSILRRTEVFRPWSNSTRSPGKAVKQTNQALPFTPLTPWPALTGFMAGGPTDFAAKQAAIVAAGPLLGAAMVAAFAP
jgi:hypothetical protein